jgi:hypothetical protein
MQIDIRSHYYFSKRFKGIGVILSTDGPTWGNVDRVISFEIKLLWFGFWVSLAFRKHLW